MAAGGECWGTGGGCAPQQWKEEGTREREMVRKRNAKGDREMMRRAREGKEGFMVVIQVF